MSTEHEWRESTEIIASSEDYQTASPSSSSATDEVGGAQTPPSTSFVHQRRSSSAVLNGDEAILRPILTVRNKWEPHSTTGRDPLINGDYCLSVDGRYVFSVCYNDPEMGENNPRPGLYVCDMWREGARGTYAIPELPACTILGFTEFITGEALLMTKRLPEAGVVRQAGRNQRHVVDDHDGFDLYKVQIDHTAKQLRSPNLFKTFARPATNAVVTWWGPEVFFLFFDTDKSSCKLHWLNPLKNTAKQVEVTFPEGVMASDDCLFTNNGRIYMFSVAIVDGQRRRGQQLIWIDFLNAFNVGTVSMTPDPKCDDFPTRFGDICIESFGRLFAFRTDPNSPSHTPDASCWVLDMTNFQWHKWQDTSLDFRYQPIVWLAVTNHGKGILLRQGYDNASDLNIRTRLHSFWITPPSLKRSAWDSVLRLPMAKRRRAIDTYARFA